MPDQLVTYFSDNGSSDDESFDCAAAEAELEALDADLESGEDEASNDEDDVVDLSLAKGQLPGKSIGFINPKAGWGDKAKIVATRKGKIDLNYFPADGKALVIPRDDLQPTSSGLKPRLSELWVVATRGAAQTDRALLVAFGPPESVSTAPKTAEWGFSLLPPQQDERIVHEIITAKNIPLTADLKSKLLSASNPTARSLAELPAAVREALEAYGGLAYSSSTVAYLERQAKTLAAKPKSSGSKKPKPAAPMLPLLAKTKPKQVSPRKRPAAVALAPEPEPKPPAVSTTELTFTLTVTGPRSKIAKLMEQTA